MQDIDQPGQFYLGRRHDLSKGKTSTEPVLYDADDLTTHAVCVGMTGSGKTGLCISLLEEAALGGVPAIAIDPKGDLANLLLTFPDLKADDFQPWIDPATAVRQKITIDKLAKKTADDWKKGLKKWGEDGKRIRRFKDSVECTIYTPGSSAGVPLTVLKSFDAPPRAVLDDVEALGDRVQATASGVLTLLGVDADPATSREHILLSKVLETAWRAGRDLDLPALIREVQKPPFGQVGAVPLDSFLAPKDRDALAMRLNNLLASPSFASWLEGEPLDVERLLYKAPADDDGSKKPRLSIISIAHLGESERMFVVTLLLNEIISWMRSQPGTSSLRAILYMDEVFGYFPPTANPPAKRPMLTLLKQARAYGVGCVLATQNPVDLDYKGLSNAGTWFLGRLQTERDKLRVLEGLEGASAQAGASFDRQTMEATLAGLGKRIFLMNNVHDDAPTVFESRWALSYLAGPLTRSQIAGLMKDRRPEATAAAPAAATSPAISQRPLLSADITQRFWPAVDPTPAAIAYRPALFGVGRVHFVEGGQTSAAPRDVRLLLPVNGEVAASPWDTAKRVDKAPQLLDDPQGAAAFGEIPGSFGEKSTFKGFERELDDWLYRNERLTRWTSAELGQTSKLDEAEADFRARAATALQTLRRERIAKDQEASLARLKRELASAQSDYDQNSGWFMELAANIGPRLAEILFYQWAGRRSRKQVMTTGIWNRAMRSRRQAKEAKRQVHDREAEIEAKKQADQLKLAGLERAINPASLALTKESVSPRRGDVDVDEVMLVWLPWREGADGATAPAY